MTQKTTAMPRPWAYWIKPQGSGLVYGRNQKEAVKAIKVLWPSVEEKNITLWVVE